jgi:hypothetical protein
VQVQIAGDTFVGEVTENHWQLRSDGINKSWEGFIQLQNNGNVVRNYLLNYRTCKYP